MPKLNGSEDNLEVLTILADGNPGAISCLTVVAMDLDLDDLTKMQVMYTLDAMEIRGPRIWLAFNDWANHNLDQFVTAIQQRNPAMIAYVNEHHPEEPMARSDLE